MDSTICEGAQPLFHPKKKLRKPPPLPHCSKHFLKTLRVQLGHHALKMPAEVPEAIGSLVDFGPAVGLLVVLVERVLAAGAEHVLLHHHLRGAYKHVQLAGQQLGLDVGAGRLFEGQVPPTAPAVLLDVVHLHGEGALVVAADAGDVEDVVLTQRRQALAARDTHGGQMAPVVLARVKTEEVFT